MKNFIIAVGLILSSQLAVSQIVRTVWATDFENGGAYPPCSDTSNSRDTIHGFDWGISSALQYNGLYSDSAQVHSYDTLWFSTCAFSTLSGTVADTFITLEFNQICKVSLFDGGYLEVSNDSGSTWTLITQSDYISTKGAWDVRLRNNTTFNELIYAHKAPGGQSTWFPGTDSVPDNTWWEYEYFNLSSYLGGTNASANCMVRWALWDGGGTSPGPENRYGWLLDSIRVKSSPCEIIKPRALFRSPQIFNGSLLYSLGPFNVYAQLWDEDAGFCDAWLVYSVNGGPLDSVSMDSINNSLYNTSLDSVYVGVIPKVYNGVDSFKAGDTVCYYINVYDCSIPCRNKYSIPDDPVIKCNQFYLTNGQPIPYCDNFDSAATANFWDTTMVGGTVGWELGNPSTVGGYNAHSPPNAWTTVLNNNYQANDEYYVNSPIFDFTSAVTPRIEFWHRQAMPNSSSDGDRFRLEYSINNNTWTWLGGAFDPAGKLLNLPPNCPSTWYNQTNGWSGNWSNRLQWRQAFYQLPSQFTAQNQVQFRFAFDADNNAQTGYGISVDDWCVYNPPKIDVSTLGFIRPSFDFIKTAGAKDSVKIIIRNIGTDSLKSIPLSFEVIPLDPHITQPIQKFSATLNYPHGIYGAAGLPPLEIDTFNFIDSTNWHLIPEGLYEIIAYPEIIGDADAENDTSETKGHFGFITDTITYFNDFDTVPVRWTTTVPEKPSCGNPAPPTPTRWHLGKPNWNVTNSTYSAPNSWDINLDTSYDNDAFEILYTNKFDMTNADSAFLSFWHNRNTVSGEDGYYVDYSTNGGTFWLRLSAASQPVGRKINWANSYPPLYGNVGEGWSGLTSAWEYSQIPVNNATFRGQKDVMFRFVFRSDNADVSDGVSIDDFRIVNPDLYDAEMFDIILPVRACVKTIAEPVDIVVKNVGKDSLWDVPVAYKFRFDSTCTGNNWSAWTTLYHDTIRDTILPGLDVTHRFIDSANMSIFGCYEFCTYVNYGLDNNETNDSLCGYIVENVRGCDIDFQVTTGATPPDGEIIMQDSATNDTLWLQPFSAIGPNVIQWKADICLYDEGAYRFQITSTDTAMITWWRLRDPFADTVVLIGTDPVDTTFRWKCPPLLSAATERIRPYGAALLPIPQDYQIDIRTRNKGMIRLSYVWSCTEIEYTKPCQKAGQQVFRKCDSLWFGFPGDPVLFPRITTVDSIWAAEPGEYLITSYTFDPNGNPDSATFDDTARLVFTVLDTVSSLPYCNEFDTCGTNPWASLSNDIYDTLSSWDRGTPNQSTLGSAHSAPNSWMTDLDNDYPLLDSSSLYSPEFTIDTTCFNMEFEHIFKTEHAFDGGTVEYTLDSGKTWRRVGDEDPNSNGYNVLDTAYPWSTQNWWNTPYVTGLGGQPHPPGWTGTSLNGWRNSFRDFRLYDVGYNPVKVVFRFRFGTDASVQDEGWAIDDFCFDATGTCKYWSCTDGIQNGFETGVDCGGPECDPCETCFDGSQNQNEEDIDCGGVCPPCPSCVDNELNGQETEPDCGGPDCDPCPSCSDGIQTENWVENPPGTWTKVWEDGVDCGGNCPNPCWLGVDEIDPNIFFLGQVVPNPAHDITTVTYQLPEDGMATITVQNILGVVVYQQNFEQLRGIHKQSIDVSGWSTGQYYLSLEFNGEKFIEKIVVNNQ